MTTSMYSEFIDFLTTTINTFLDTKIYPFTDSGMYFTFKSLFHLMLWCMFVALALGIIYVGSFRKE